MAEQRSEFSYHNIQLYKSESLGSGSYGGVCKARCDGLLCAAKIMHPTLFDLRDPGTVSYLHKFQEECHFLSLARHPNVVQYLATYTDPDTRLPVLLMELCDESLTAFLERSPGPLSYHIQLNICQDITLALVYLHSNGLIHRDLSGNNVLLIAGTRAKITDFGMSKLSAVNPRMTPMTLCPGNLLYMPPEALDEDKYYTDKLDIFSLGVIVIQILTRKFPNPTEKFRVDHSYYYAQEIRLVVPENQRRQAHLQLIPEDHPLKPLALECLKKEHLRPSALQLNQTLLELKKADRYRESRVHVESNTTGDRYEIDYLRRQAQELLQQNMEKEHLNQHLEEQVRILTETKTREASAHRAEMQSLVKAKEKQLQECKQDSGVKLQEKMLEIATKDRELQLAEERLEASQQIVLQFQQSLQLKDNIISDLRLEIRELKEQEMVGSAQSQLPVTAKTATAESEVSTISRERKNAPESVSRRAAVRQQVQVSRDTLCHKFNDVFVHRSSSTGRILNKSSVRPQWLICTKIMLHYQLSQFHMQGKQRFLPYM